MKVLNSIIFLGKATQYVKEEKNKEFVKGHQSSQVSSRTLEAQVSATLLDSAQCSSISLVDEKKKTGKTAENNKNLKAKPHEKTLAEIDRYTLCNKEIVVF